MSLHPTTGKDELILIMLGMLRDLHNNYDWGNLSASLEEVREAAKKLGIEEDE